jgi:hypothetical protein
VVDRAWEGQKKKMRERTETEKGMNGEEETDRQSAV